MRLVDLDMWRQHSSGHPILDVHSLPAAYDPFTDPAYPGDAMMPCRPLYSKEH